MSVKDFIEDAASAGHLECFNKVLNRWPPLVELIDHGALVGMEILETISKRVKKKRPMEEDELFAFLETNCAKELELLKNRAESYKSSTFTTLTVEERKERMGAYENMDFCDDFDTYCEYYGLPFNKFGEVYGAKMLQDYVESLGTL